MSTFLEALSQRFEALSQQSGVTVQSGNLCTLRRGLQITESHCRAIAFPPAQIPWPEM